MDMEELEIVREALEEYVRQRGLNKAKIFFFDQLSTFDQLIEDLRLGNERGREFARLVIERGLDYALTHRHSSIFDTLADKMEGNQGRFLFAYLLPVPIILTPRQMAEHIRNRTEDGKIWVKGYLKAVMERRVFADKEQGLNR